MNDIKYWIDEEGEPHVGDPQTGAREATAEETEQIKDGVYRLTLEEQKTKKIAELEKAAALNYVSGFISNATGDNLLYDSALEDQQLIEGLYNRAKEPDWATTARFPGLCPVGTVIIRARASSGDEKKEILHDGPALIRLGKDLDSHLMKVKVAHWQKQKEVLETNSYQDLKKITW